MNLCSIAKVLLQLFGFEDSESDIYWLFSGFAKQWEANMSSIHKMVRVVNLFAQYAIRFIVQCLSLLSLEGQCL